MTEEQLQSIKEFQQKAIRVENGFTHVNLDYCEAVAKDVPLLIAEIERLKKNQQAAMTAMCGLKMDLDMLRAALLKIKVNNFNSSSGIESMVDEVSEKLDSGGIAGE